MKKCFILILSFFYILPAFAQKIEKGTIISGSAAVGLRVAAEIIDDDEKVLFDAKRPVAVTPKNIRSFTSKVKEGDILSITTGPTTGRFSKKNLRGYYFEKVKKAELSKSIKSMTSGERNGIIKMVRESKDATRFTKILSYFAGGLTLIGVFHDLTEGSPSVNQNSRLENTKANAAVARTVATSKPSSAKNN